MRGSIKEPYPPLQRVIGNFYRVEVSKPKINVLIKLNWNFHRAGI